MNELPAVELQGIWNTENRSQESEFFLKRF
jgi:hypothetical protein